MPVCVRCFRVQPSAEITFRRAHGAPTCRDVAACKLRVVADRVTFPGRMANALTERLTHSPRPRGVRRAAEAGTDSAVLSAGRARPPRSVSAYRCTPGDIDESGEQR